MRVLLLHGFLGLPSDWDFPELMKARTDESAPFNEKVDLYRFGLKSFDEWADALNDSVRDSAEKPFLAGYSLGARLAMHAITRAPELWAGAALISGNPGLEDPAARSQRTEADERWARRFERDDWQELCRDWNAQPAFGGRAQSLPRREQDFRRAELAHALRAWSLGRQENLLPALSEISLPLLWVAGAEDRRYVELGQSLSARRSRPFRLEIVPGAGHRVPWERPREFQERFCGFIANELKGSHLCHR